jgi:hypothetical protein
MTRLATAPATESAERDATEGAGVSTDRSDAQKQHTEAVKEACRRLRGAFMSGKEAKPAQLVQRIVQQLFQNELGRNADTESADYKEKFQYVAKMLGENVDEMVKELAASIKQAVTDIDLAADPGVTLKGNIVALDMSQHYANFKPSRRDINQTYANLQF